MLEIQEINARNQVQSGGGNMTSNNPTNSQQPSGEPYNFSKLQIAQAIDKSTNYGNMDAYAENLGGVLWRMFPNHKQREFGVRVDNDGNRTNAKISVEGVGTFEYVETESRGLRPNFPTFGVTTLRGYKVTYILNNGERGTLMESVDHRTLGWDIHAEEFNRKLNKTRK